MENTQSMIYTHSMNERRLVCKRESCLHDWTPRVANPKWCPKCHYKEWEEKSDLRVKVEKIMNKTPTPTKKRKYEKRKGYKMASKEVIAYCFRCRCKVPMDRIKYRTFQNGKRAISGKCRICETKMCTILKDQ